MGARGPVKKDVAVVVGGEPKAHRGAAAAVRSTFRRIVETVPKLSAADEATVETLAEALVLQRASFAAILEHGLLVEDKAHGNELRRNPALIAWRTAAEVARASAAKLGATPLDRARLGVQEDDGAPDLADVLFGKVAHDAGA